MMNDDVFRRKISSLKKLTKLSKKSQQFDGKFYFLFKSKLSVTLNGRGFFFGMPLNDIATVISFYTVPVGLGI